MRGRHYCHVCHGMFKGNEGTGFMVWFTCNRCKSLVAAEKRKAQAAPELPPAGWFRDPDDPNGERWWDGVEWSEHRR